MGEMTYEQMKFRLGDYVRCRRVLDRTRRELALLEDRLRVAGISIDYSKPKIRTSAAGNAAFADWITEAMFLRKQLKAEEKETQAAKGKVAALIGTLEDKDQRDVLKYKYLRGMTWWETGQVMGYSRDWTRHIGYEAVKQLTEDANRKSRKGKVSHPKPPLT